MILGASVMAIRPWPPRAAPRGGAGGLGLGHRRPLGDDGGAVGLQADAAPHPHQGAVRRHRLGQRARRAGRSSSASKLSGVCAPT